MLIRVRNNLTELAQKTFLSYTESSGVGTVRVQNISAFSANWAVQLGGTGQEQSEIKLINSSAPSGTALVFTANTTYEHPEDTPIYAIKYDQLIFKRSTSGTAGTATPMTDGTVSITPDSLYTVFDDTTGASSYAYKTTFKNSVTGDTSDDSDWITPAGFNWYALANIRNRIKGKLFSSGYITDESDIDSWVNEYYEKMNAVAVDVNEDYALGTVDVAFASTTGLGTIISSDFLYPTRAWVTTDGVNYFQATKQKANDYQPTQEFNLTAPYLSFQGDTVFEVKPAETAGTVRFQYQKLFTPLVNDTDEVPLYMRNYTTGFVHYGLAQALKKDEKWGESKSEESESEKILNKFKSQITPRIKTGPTFIDIYEAVSGDDGTFY